MPASYRDDVILAPASALRPGEIDRLNRLLHDAGLGRPLRNPADSAAEVAVLPVDGVDPMVVRDALRRVASQRGEDLPELTPDFQYAAHTVEDDARQRRAYYATGKPSGHGLMAWLSAPAYAMPKAPAWRYVRRRPVVALLDTPVEPHAWLPRHTDDDRFLLDASDWRPVRIQEPAAGEVGSHRGHGTFLAGLIRLRAPDARILPVRVMSDNGQVSNCDLVRALEWLVRYNHDHDEHRVDVVCMAFGGRLSVDGPDPKTLKPALEALRDQRVKIVASAGNDGSEQPTSPAVLATDPDLESCMVSVGARRSPTERAPFSNYGVWVREWGEGSNVISIMPMTIPADDDEMAADVDGYAWWSGTSFAAATCAAALAQPTVTGEPLHAAPAKP